MITQYIRLNSVTWWTLGFVPLVCGLFLALEPIHNMTYWAEAVRQGSGGVGPAFLIVSGVGAMGLRKAID